MITEDENETFEFPEETWAALETASHILGKPWMWGQLKAFAHFEGLRAHQDGEPLDAICVYYPTGKGKTWIQLGCVYLRGYKEAVIVAPPITHPKWIEDAAKLGIKATMMSHAKFRQADTKLNRKVPLVIDEFHMLGGQTGMGWKKLDRAAAGLQAPLIFASATPEYNDAERVYCVAHVTDPFSHRGGYEAWLYRNCVVEPHRFRVLPTVLGFHQYKDAEEFLVALPHVVHVPDEAPDIIKDVDMSHVSMPDVFEDLGLDTTQPRIMASQMEKRHRRRYLQIVDPTQRGHELEQSLREDVMDQMWNLVDPDKEKLLIFCMHATVAEVVYDTLVHGGGVGLITGKTKPVDKNQAVQDFINGDMQILIGTATMATGTDGMDKVCNTMIILDDTDDNAQRRQLVGRILHRGAGTSDQDKVAWRFVFPTE